LKSGIDISRNVSFDCSFSILNPWNKRTSQKLPCVMQLATRALEGGNPSQPENAMALFGKPVSFAQTSLGLRAELAVDGPGIERAF
jgi:hypothetical protein